MAKEGNEMKRPRGTGSIYTQPGSAKFWVQYYRNGKPFRESTHLTDRRKAEKFLQNRLAEVATGNFLGPRIEKISVAELAEDLQRDYRINRRKSQEWAERRWRLHLEPFFGHLRCVQVSSDVLARYVDERQAAGAKAASINRELAFLKRAFRLGYKATPPKVQRVPAFPMLKETNVRKGFLEDAQYDQLAAECAKEGLWLRAMLATYYNFGWRKSELLGLRVNQVDLFTRTIRLEVGETKNSQGRTVKMPEEVYHLISACTHGKKGSDHVFSRTDGNPVKDFRKAWQKVCVAAGVGSMVCRKCGKVATDKKRECGCEALRYEGLILHDLRRTGARNLRRLGVGETTAMKIGGWKTRSVFQRYDIVSESDLTEAARLLDVKRAEMAETKREQEEKDSKFSHSSAIVEGSEAVALVTQPISRAN